MSKRWGSEDKIELMRQYATGKSYEEISGALGRSPNAIKLRLESIVYENITKGKPISMLSRMLNTNNDTIKQFYYSHKSFRQGRGEDVKNIDFDKLDRNAQNTHNAQSTENIVNNILGGGINNELKHRVLNNNVNLPNKHLNISNTNLDVKNKNFDVRNKHLNVQNKNKNTNKKNHKQSTKRNIKRVEEENHILKEIIKNYRMNRHVKKLYANGKLDKKSSTMFEKLLRRSNEHN